MELELGTAKPVNIERFAYEVKQVAGAYADGWLSRDGIYYLVLDDNTPQNVLTQIETIYANHDPSQKTPEQLRAEKAQAALAELGAADYRAWQNSVSNISNLAEAKTKLSQLGRVVWLILQAQGINETP